MPRDWDTWAMNVTIPPSSARTSDKRHEVERDAELVLIELAGAASTDGVVPAVVSMLARDCELSVNRTNAAILHLKKHTLITSVRQNDRYLYYLDPANNPAYLALTSNNADEVRQ